RPKELADDYTGTNDVVKHAIRWFQDQGENVSLVCCIYATAPFIDAKYLKKGYEKLHSSKKMYAFSVTSFPFPIQRAIRINANDEVEAIWPENISRRSQDLEEAYHDAGQFYWGRSEAFLNNEIVFSRVSIPVVLPRHLVQDIDTLEDWYRAELMFKAWKLAKVD
ncbi:MAG: pseudaminic acid cytidylyltransferase, partial [Gammaproteobacteria bacterium]|nr:pseudaminic acid cytidylyltransferase [Gammaproteobacteria bacterium]